MKRILRLIITVATALRRRVPSTTAPHRAFALLRRGELSAAATTLSRLRCFLVILCAVVSMEARAADAPDAPELTKLLNDFLAGASHDDAATHNRFWADDLIYTRSAGKRVNKSEIMANLKRQPGEPETIYSAEDLRIQQYGATAIVAFRLVGKTKKDGATQVANFLNTGTFLKRNGKWQAVAWQATRVPRTDDETKKEVASATDAFRQALHAADSKKLESLTDETFIATTPDGNQVSRKEFIDQVHGGRLKYPETKDDIILVYGDTAMVRGKFIALTFVNKEDAWKAIALQMIGSRRD